MQSISVELELLSPVCIAQRPTSPGHPTETLAYLTGTVLRGGFATVLLHGRRYEELNASEKQQFRQFFLNGQLLFHNGWPRDPRAGRTWVVPRTAWTPKDDSGWSSDSKGGVRDVLFALLNDEDISDGDWKGWDRLGQDFVTERRGSWNEINVRRRLITRAALTRNDPDLSPATRGVVVEGQLYSFEALETGTIFTATISAGETLLESFQKFFAPTELVLSIGQGRSRGLGQVLVRIDFSDQAEDRDLAQLLMQAEDFSQRAGADTNTTYLPITLESDVILRDNYLLPCSGASPAETLWRYQPSTDTIRDMRLHDAVQSTRWIGGWDELRRIPRPPQLAMQTGSVWVYAVPKHAAQAAIAWWLSAETHGIGERRSEGFGRVRLLHPFHAEDAKR